MEMRKKRGIMKGQRKERCRERYRTSRKPESLILSFFSSLTLLEFLRHTLLGFKNGFDCKAAV